MNVIGIDLGTTNSEVAVIDAQGRPRVLDIDGSPLVPSVVTVSEHDEVLIGRPAVNAEALAPERCIRWIKRRMGSGASLELGGRVWSPAMVSSRILAYLKAAAERHLGAPVEGAVITVPAFFDERAREDTRQAAELAGLPLLRLLNEPTAAAAAYAMGQRRAERWLVYDLGGGTFDVSVVDCSEAVMEVLASHGDTRLGGHDCDRLLADEAARAFQRLHGIDLRRDEGVDRRLLNAAEQAKVRLSTAARAVIRDEFIARDTNGVDLHLDHGAERLAYEEMIAPLIDRSLNSVHQALREAACEPADIARVILVGGSTRTPLIAERLRAELGLEPQAWLDPDRVVARGAAIEAAALAGTRLGSEMVDITPHSLGTLAMSAPGTLENCILIHRNSPLPCVASHIFYKAHEMVDGIEVDVTQGESRDPDRVIKLGSFPVDGLAADPRRDVHFRFELDRSGLLRVLVEHLGSGVSTEQVIERASEVRSATIESLPAVRLGESAIALADDDDEDLLPGPDADAPEPDRMAESAQADGDDADDTSELLTRADALLTDDALEPGDRTDLQRARDDAATGDAAAAERLAELLYFLE